MTDESEKRVLKVGDDVVTIDSKASKKIFGSADFDFISGIASQLINVVTQGQTPKDSDMKFVVSFLSGIEPKDELETMLAVQMFAVHNATATFARRLAHVENIAQQDSAERALNKLARTFAMQMQALQKYRSGGTQKVVVKHVHVSEGGQAIVGNIESGGRGK